MSVLFLTVLAQKKGNWHWNRRATNLNTESAQTSGSSCSLICKTELTIDFSLPHGVPVEVEKMGSNGKAQGLGTES